MRLILASASPRREQLLRQIGLDFEVEASRVDESRHPDEGPGEYVERLARAKAGAVAGPERVVLAADTIVLHEGRILGKPAHPEEARTMLRRLQGDRHEVVTGVCVAGWEGEPVIHSTVDLAEVELLPLTDEEIADYVDTGEPMDKAGAYALQGLGARFVSAVRGSPFTVIGLPLHVVPILLERAGCPVPISLPNQPYLG
ncbi:MAG TPA: septum formation protein Maf [Acidimicrobiia bacterium]|nr:septum formation protein Maf [Acidimicrobiia bacterium]